MSDIENAFDIAVRQAQAYNGSESAYQRLTLALLAFKYAGGDRKRMQTLVDIYTQSSRTLKNPNVDDFLINLEAGGAKVFRHGAVFIRPDSPHEQNQSPYTAHLQSIITMLEQRQIYFDDLIVDVGAAPKDRAQQSPYIIVTIPRINAQIAIANQADEPLFIARPAIPYMNWALFKKDLAGKPGTAFQNITEASTWEYWFMQSLLANDPIAPKVNLDGYVKAHRKSKYLLTEEMVVAMAGMWRNQHPEKQWPNQHSEPIPRSIIVAVTGDENWRSEDWANINLAGFRKTRGLTRSLAQTLDAHCPERGKMPDPAASAVPARIRREPVPAM